MGYDARDVANFLLDDGDQGKIGISPLALQKIIFFSHGWYLAYLGKGLVENEFEAWKYGPVIPVIWKEFKNFRSRPITDRASYVNPLTNEKFFRSYCLKSEDEKILRVLLKYYSRFPAEVLSELSHQAGMPWRIVKEGMAHSANFGGVISDSLIRETFHSFKRQWPLPPPEMLLTDVYGEPSFIATGGDSIRPV